MNVNVRYNNELINLLKEKDLNAFSDLYDKYAPALYTVILQIIREEEIANNVLQNVFTQILYKIETYDAAKECLFIWMFKIARNLAIDMVRSRTNQQTLQQTPLTKEMLLKVANVEIDNYGLKKVIMKLKDEHRMLVELCYYQGLSYDEIAKALNIPVDSVQPGLKTALLELRTLLL